MSRYRRGDLGHLVYPPSLGLPWIPPPPPYEPHRVVVILPDLATLHRAIDGLKNL